ncbi:FxLYD domain-containing protein [Clostridium pasteurianum]|uniref:FxLYD domain-containing protein n=1 Tax=Clostridium pasteurianum TaxID=1501 RepID=UPI0022609265|nr:FxLYD domain-containing protein [Clostridium pasteurianum]UZW14348.1 FxLYD domain-containing protein [Clostridium pasteurianum]
MKFKKIIFLFLFIGIFFIGCTNKQSIEKDQINYSKYINLSNYSIILSDDGISYKIHGNATNNYTKEFDYVSTTLTFYDGNKIIETYPIGIFDLKSNETKEFSFTIENQYKDSPYKLNVDFAVLSDK